MPTFIIAILGLILAISSEKTRKKKNPSPYKTTQKQKTSKKKNITNAKNKTGKSSIFSQKNKTSSSKRNKQTESYNTSKKVGKSYLRNETDLDQIEVNTALKVNRDEKIEVELLSEIKDEFLENPKKAFIFSEIFNRKY